MISPTRREESANLFKLLFGHVILKKNPHQNENNLAQRMSPLHPVNPSISDKNLALWFKLFVIVFNV